MDKLLKQGLLLFIKGYQKIISPYLPPSCRFTPTCSEYTRQAVEKYGVFKGFAMGLKRLSRCHPGVFLGKSRPSCFVLSPVDIDPVRVNLFYASSSPAFTFSSDFHAGNGLDFPNNSFCEIPNFTDSIFPLCLFSS